MAVTRIDAVWVQTELLNLQNLGRIKKKHKTDVYAASTRTGMNLGMVHWYLDRFILTPSVEVVHPRHKHDIEEACKWLTAEHRARYPRRLRPMRKRRADRIRALLKRPDGGGLDKRYAPVV